MKTNQLPPLPKPDIAQHTQEVWIDDVRCTRQLGPRYTADQMRAYALQARAQVQGEPVTLQHMAVAENGALRWMTGRKVQNCELYAMPDFGRAPTLYATPQPSVPGDVVRDAKRYRWLRQHQLLAKINYMPTPSGEDLDAAIDDAMLAAKKRTP